MATALRIAIILTCLAASAPAMTAEVSPWLGSADQVSFQLDPATMVAVASETGEVMPPLCRTQGCKPGPLAAKEGRGVGSTPQN